MAIPVRPAAFNDLDRMLGEHKDMRMPRESEWQLLADVFMPRKDFSLPQKPAELRRRRLTSSIPGMSLRRGAAILVGQLVSMSQPFVKPNVESGLVAAGRNSELDAESRDFLSGVEWKVYDAMLSSKSRFLSSAGRLSLELLCFGSGVQWIGRRQGGGGPLYQTRPLRSCWFSENEDGEVDTLFYCFTLPLWKCAQRWGQDRLPEKWRTDLGDEKKAREAKTIYHAVYPRIGGQARAFALAKPFAEVYFTQDDKTILQEAGYDSFPYAVPRLGVEEGSCYGTGLAWHVAPEALVLHSLTQLTENAVGLRADPPLMIPKRMFAKGIDRRMGAVNYYDGAGLGFQNANQAIQRLDIAGNVEVAAAWLARLETNVEQGFFVDFLRLRESGNMTAEEVRERRRLRIGAMAGFVPEIDRDWMGRAADRTLDVMVADGTIRGATEQLAGVDVDWDYAGPLAIEQLRGNVDSVEIMARLALETKDLDPSASYAFNLEEGLREVAEALALGPKTMRTRAEVQATREAQEQAQALAQNTQLAEMAGRALQAGGQGAANIATAEQIQNGNMRKAA